MAEDLTQYYEKLIKYIKQIRVEINNRNRNIK